MALPPTMRSLVESGEDIGKYFPDDARRANVIRATGAYKLANVSAPRTRESVLGEGSFGEVALESFPSAGAAAAAPRVAVKKTLADKDYESVCAETAALRYCVGLPNVAQLVGVVSSAAAGNAVTTALPRIMMAPAKSSLADLLRGPTAKHATASDRAREIELKAAWGDLYPYAIEDDGFVPAFDTDGNPFTRADAEARRNAASAASKRVDDNRRILARSWSNIKSICLQILRGYHVLHSWGLVHRDTKPRNMLVTHYGEVQITDFGMTRYHTKYLEPIQDSFTGSFWYASPEVLLADWLRSNRKLNKNFTEQEWKKHDAWAVGASLYEVLTRDESFKGNDYLDLLNYIFAVKGAPVAEDGFIFRHFSKLPDAATISGYPRNPSSIISRLQSRSIIVSPDYDPLAVNGPSEFLQLAKVIQGLLELNPKRRLSIEEALNSPLFGGAPVMPPRPLISSSFLIDMLDFSDIVTRGREINNRMLALFNNWLMKVSIVLVKRESAPFVLDRAITYCNLYYQYYSTEGRAKMLSAQASGKNYIDARSVKAVCIIALMISAYLFRSDYKFEFDLRLARSYVHEEYEIPFLRQIFSLFIEGNIPFYGRTYFDELLAADPVLPTLADPTPRIYALGTLNAICLSSKYYDFRNHLPVLYRFMSEHATKHKAMLGSYFISSLDSWDKTPVRPEIKEFMDPLSSIVAAAKTNKPYLVEYFLSLSRPSEAVIEFARSAACPPVIAEMILAAAPAPAPAPTEGGARKKSKKSRKQKNSQRKKSKKNRKI